MILQNTSLAVERRFLCKIVGKGAQGRVRSEIRWSGNIISVVSTSFNALVKH